MLSRLSATYRAVAIVTVPPGGHRVACIGDEVDDDLLELTRIGMTSSGVAASSKRDASILRPATCVSIDLELADDPARN